MSHRGDPELVRAPTAPSQLFARHERQLRAQAAIYARKLGAAPSEAEDWVSVAVTHVWSVCGQFDPGRGVSFTTWANAVLWNRLQSCRRRRQSITSSDLPLETEVDIADDSPPVGEDIAEELLLVELRMRVAGAALQQAEQDFQVALRLSRGESIESIARDLGTTRYGIRGVIGRLRPHLELMPDGRLEVRRATR